MSSPRDEDSKSYKRSRSRSPVRASSPVRRRSRTRSRSGTPPPKKETARSPSPRKRSRSPSPRRSRTPPRRARSRTPPRKRSSRSRSRSPVHRRDDRNRGPSQVLRRDDRGHRSNNWQKMIDREPAPPSKVLGIFGLSSATEKETVSKTFEKFGKLENTIIIYDRQTGLSKGFGFVYFEEVSDAKEAREACNGMTLDGRQLRVDFSLTNKAHEPTPGQYLGKKGSGFGDRDFRGYGDRDMNHGGGGSRFRDFRRDDRRDDRRDYGDRRRSRSRSRSRSR